MQSPRPLPQDEHTWSAPLDQVEQADRGIAALTLMWHPDLRRLGQQALLADVGEPASLSRFTPLFRAAPGDAGEPLLHASVSRHALRLTVLPDGGARLEITAGRMSCEVDGRPLPEGGVLLSAAAVDRGTVLLLGGRVAICLHRVSTLAIGPRLPALAGVSSAMTRLRRQVDQVARTEMPVLVLGESGTGKELVAQAIHARSARSRAPMVSVNMAALSDSLAAADLFGAARGAYTGAQTSRKGLFAEASGGTLFFDEIGDTPATVQPMLLRVLETGRYRPLGSSQDEHADVRLVAATDRDLTAVGFNQPLLRRLEAFVIRTPPLRERREDLGVLIAHMLRATLGDAAWPEDVPPSLVRALCLHDWPGNVRQLGHAVQRLVLGWQSGQWPTVSELLGVATSAVPLPAAAVDIGSASPTGDLVSVESKLPVDPLGATTQRPFRDPAEVGAEELLAALESAQWTLRSAAQLLGVSRPSLYNLIERHSIARDAEALTRAEIEAAISQLPAGDLPALASRLRTPREALKRRLNALRITLTR